MPKYNTVHDIFPYLYLFRRNSITQSPTLHVLSKLYRRIRLEEFLSVKILHFWIKTTRYDCWSLLFSQVAIKKTWISQNFPNVSSTRDKMQSCDLASCLPIHNWQPGNSAFFYSILLSDFRLYTSARRLLVGHDWSIEGCLLTQKFLVARVYHVLFICHRISYCCRILFIHETAGILFFLTGFLVRF